MRGKSSPIIRASRFSPTPLGYLRWSKRSKRKLAERTWDKWRPIILLAEELREGLFDGRPWSEVDPEEIAYELMPAVYARCRGRGGRQPSENTLRGRFDACSSYFEFLRIIGALPSQPLDYVTRPSSKANDRPFLEPAEDALLAALPKEGHGLAVYALARGCALREEEICNLEDADVDLEHGVVRIREGKTVKAIRRVPATGTAHVLLSRYRAWRDENITAKSTKFVRTRSGSISKGYVWKLVKQMARRAGVGLILDEHGQPMRGDDGELLTRVTPHALRRTWGSDLMRRGVDPAIFSKTMGHASKRVTEESYALISTEEAMRRAMLAAGEGPFSLSHGISELDRELAGVCELPAADPQRALRELARLERLAVHMRQSISRALPR